MKAGTHGIIAILYSLVALCAIIYFCNVPSAHAMILAIVSTVWSAEHSVIAAIKRKGDE